jgi:hypothetical protein
MKADAQLDTPPPPQDAAQSGVKLLVKLHREIDFALTTFARALPGGLGGEKIAKAKRLIMEATGEALAAAGDVPAVSPDEAGDQFAGGGIGSGVPST